MGKINLFSVHHLLASCFFIGYTPYLPGTTASFVAMITLFLLPTPSIIVSLIMLNVLFVVGAIISERVSNQTKKVDASFIVIDEWLGMSIALFLLPHNIWLYLLAFVLFRIFDILKPPPISYLESIPGGLGVMLDDAAAGFFTFVIIQIIALFF